MLIIIVILFITMEYNKTYESFSSHKYNPMMTNTNAAMQNEILPLKHRVQSRTILGQEYSPIFYEIGPNDSFLTR